ncbi:Protein of unknown function [Leuconostoc citreum]|nr:Protein of unknown function [Leuconostoc citreum]CDX66022.1 Protein of unknown function [Leuconostoc citreum]
MLWLHYTRHQVVPHAVKQNSG